MTTTIPKSASSDPFYRYRRDLLKIVRINSSGGMYQLVNLDKIAKEIGRSPAAILSYLKKTLHTNILTKGGYFIKGNTSDFETVLESYIITHVICKKCKNPETDGNKCRACGALTYD